LQALSQDLDLTLAHPAAYACQALLHMPNDEKLWQSILRRSLKVSGGILDLAQAVRTCDPKSLLSMFERFNEAFGGLDKAISLAKEMVAQTKILYGGGKSFFESVREGFDFKPKRPWYAALRYTALLIQSGQLVELKAFVRQAPVETRTHKHFLLALSQQLERLVRTAHDPEVQQGALAFLTELLQNSVQGNKNRQVKEILTVALRI
jgi:hypothetical protein